MKLVPVVFVHMCCGDGYVFGQDARGDNYKRRTNAPSSSPWEPIPPALGAASRRSHGAKTATRKRRARR